MDTPKSDEITPGTMHYTDDGQVSFVTDDLETKLKLSSPSSTANQSFAEDYCEPNTDQIDPQLLDKLESQTQFISQNLENMIQFISNYTHSVTSLTSKSVNQYEQCLVQACDTIDSNIKLMYQLMSKYEELLYAMKPIEKLSLDIKEIKRILAIFEKHGEALTH